MIYINISLISSCQACQATHIKHLPRANIYEDYVEFINVSDVGIAHWWLILQLQNDSKNLKNE